MTIDPFITCRETEGHVLPQRKFYPAQISLSHQQLRHFLSSPQPDLLYYANKKDVYSLNTTTRRRTRVAQLPFETRCIATGYGWFCAGGDRLGYFAAFRLPEDLSSSTSNSDPPSLYHSSTHTGTIRPGIRVESLGDEIVNSVSIHTLPTIDDEDEVIAILTENDRSVRMYSLSQDCEIYTKIFPFNMNHATLSPDGKVLVIVGDKEHMFFYQRITPEPVRMASKSARQTKFIRYEWSLLSEFELHRPPGASCSGYFTTAWSPSSTLCATASEQGYITVVDMQAIHKGASDNEAILCVVSSSNPCTQGSDGEGAVRTMCFSASPWDLLIWSEASGRVCIGDLRNGLKTRQIIDLDHENNNVEHIDVCAHSIGVQEQPSVEDRSSELIRHSSMESDSNREQRRYVDRDRIHDPRRASFQNRSTDVDHGFQGLSDEERLIIEGIRTSRQRQERQSASDLYSRSRNEERPHRNSIDAQPQQSGAPWRGSSPGITLSTSQITNLVPEAFVLFSNRGILTAQDTESRNGSRSSFTVHAADARSFSTDLRRDPNFSGNGLAPTSIDPWHTIQEAHGRGFTADNLATGGSLSLDPLSYPEESLNRHVERTLERVREQESRLSQRLSSEMNNTAPPAQNNSNGNTSVSSPISSAPTVSPNIIIAEAPLDGNQIHPVTRLRLERARALDTHEENERRRRILLSSMEPGARERLRAIRDSTLRNFSSHYFGTAGVALSTDGRTLYAATHHGIFELRLNYHSRKFFAAVQPR